MLPAARGNLYRLGQSSGSGPVYIEHGSVDYSSLQFSAATTRGHWYNVPYTEILRPMDDMILRILPGQEQGAYNVNTDHEVYQYYSLYPYSLTADDGKVDGFNHPDLEGYNCFYCIISRNSSTTWWCTVTSDLMLRGNNGHYYRLTYQKTPRYSASVYTDALSVLADAKSKYESLERQFIKGTSKSNWSTLERVCMEGNDTFYVECIDPRFIYPDKGEFSFWFSRAYGGLSNSELISAQKFAEAFTQAQNKLPENKTNGIANVLDVIDTIRSIKNNPKLSIDKTVNGAKNAWLAYRYAYSTTVSDIKEIASLCERIESLPAFISSYGSVSDDKCIYNCCIKLDTAQFIPKEMKTLNERLKSAGMQVNATNVWDMIPYSFVVDWFADVSAYMEGFDAWIQASKLQIAETWYSGIVKYPDGRHVYFRWLGNPPTMPTFSPYISKNSNVWLKRIADAISLY